VADQFWLRRAAIGPQVLVPITENRHKELRNARATLVDAGAFEQRYEILLGNYLALEQFCSEWSLRGEIEMDWRYERGAKVILEANRHVMNLLTAARSYADHVVRDFKHLNLSPTFKEQAEALMRDAHSRSLSYQIMCALRNYVQHREKPVHGTKGKTSDSCSERLVIYCSRGMLEEDGKFKAEVLQKMEPQTDLRITAREYMREISGVQVELRKRVDHAGIAARKLHEEAIAEFVAAQEQPEPVTPGTGLTICREVGGKYVDAHPILLDWDDVRVLLAKKNRYVLKL
jgi:hypothetical protein